MDSSIQSSSHASSTPLVTMAPLAPELVNSEADRDLFEDYSYGGDRSPPISPSRVSAFFTVQTGRMKKTSYA